MDIIDALILILTIIPAASYGWGMRGTTIGGEKGAMLPGALIGALIAVNSDVLVIKENFFIFAALGAIGMYLGGCMTYGETLGLSMGARPATEMKRGLQGVGLKGFMWFGVFGSVFSTGINAVCKVYSPIHLVILFILTPLLSLIFMNKFNRPYSVDENKFPKYYFSKRRREYWGAMLGIIVSFLIINIINLNLFGIVFPLICAVFGCIGWVLAQLLQIYSIHYAPRSSSKISKTCFSNHNIDSWKFMECFLGGFGGLGTAVAFIVTYPLFNKTVSILETTDYISNKNNIFSVIAVIVWLILIALDMLQYIIKRPVTKAALKKQLKENTITRAEFMVKNVNAVDTVPKFYDYYEKALEPIEFILYSALPFILITLGSFHAPILVASVIMFLVMAQEVVFENEYPKNIKIISRIYFGVSVLGLLLFVILNSFIFANPPSFEFILIIYTVVYEIMSIGLTVYKNYSRQRKNGLNRFNALKSFVKCKGTIIYNIYYCVCFVVLYFVYL